MTNNPSFSDEATQAAVDGMLGLCNGGFLKIYSGTKPTDANTALGSQTLLGTLLLSATAFNPSAPSGSPGSRVVDATANIITDDTSADATGTASWFRILKADGVSPVMDGTVGTSGSDLNLASVAIIAGGDIAVTSLTVRMSE